MRAEPQLVLRGLPSYLRRLAITRPAISLPMAFFWPSQCERAAVGATSYARRFVDRVCLSISRVRWNFLAYLWICRLLNLTRFVLKRGRRADRSDISARS